MQVTIPNPPQLGQRGDTLAEAIVINSLGGRISGLPFVLWPYFATLRIIILQRIYHIILLNFLHRVHHSAPHDKKYAANGDY